MPTLEHLRKNVKEKLIYLDNEIQLPQYCLVNASIAPGIKMCPGLQSHFAPVNIRRMILGEFGIEKIDSHTDHAVAFAGFRIIDGKMEITQTPQALRPDEFTNRQEQHRLGRSKFRYEMTTVLIEVARNLGLHTIVGNCAAAHHEVELDLVRYEDIARRVDHIYETLGFEFNPHTLQYELII